MKYFLVMCIIVLWQYSIAQKMPSDYFTEGVAYMEDGEKEKSLESFRFIVDNHPRNKLYPKALFNLGTLYFETKQYDSSIRVFHRVLYSEFNEKEELGGDIMAPPFANYRHRSAEMLHQIYYKVKDYDSALYYLKLSDEKYPLIHFCGNAYASRDVYFALKYSDLYQKIKQPDKAVQALLPNVFVSLADNSKIIKELKSLLKKRKDKKELLTELDKALDNIYAEEKTYTDRDNTFTLYYMDYLGAKIEIPYDFLIDRQFIDMENIKRDIQESEFYLMVKEL